MSVIDAARGSRPEGAAGLSDTLGALFFSQARRLIALDTPLPEHALLVERFHGREGVNEIGGFQIDALSLDAHLNLQPLIGQEIGLRVQGPGPLAGASPTRSWHGIVTAASALGTDGGLARYRLHLQPWIALLGWRRDSFVYQDKTAIQIVEEVFADYAMARWRVEVSTPPRVRSLCTQYNETDLAFVQRLLREEGLNFHIEQARPSHADGEPQTWRHTLVITDDQAQHPDLGPLPFTRGETRTRGGSTPGVTAWAPRRQAQPNQVRVHAWDYRTLDTAAGSADSAHPQGDVGPLEVYDGSGAYRYGTSEAAGRRAALALAAHELDRKVIDAAGAVPSITPAATFTLVGRTVTSLGAALGASGPDDAGPSPAQSKPGYRVLHVAHEAANNLGAQAATLLQRADTEAGTYRNRFTAVPAAARLVPPGAGRILKPTAPGAQTALVVARPGQAQTTDRDLRVKVQFPWQRGAAPLPGGLAHDSPTAPDGNAPGDDRSGTWVRVAQPSAGANWGSVFVPRAGTEVLVSFVEGDIDRPVITGQLYNGTDTPVLAAGTDSGVNHPGVVSGLTVPTLDHTQLNQWVLDDATGQLRMRMATSAAAAELGLGHLIAQGSSAQRGAWLGSGFLMHSGAWTQLRAGTGLLLSTTARTGTHGSAQSTALDGTEALAQLRAAHALGQRLSDSAAAQKAATVASHGDNAAWPNMLDALEPGLKPASAPPRGDPGELPAPLAQPTVVLDAAAAAAWVSEASTAVFAAQDLSTVAQGDSHLSAGHTLSAVAGGTLGVYTHGGGIRATTGQGPLSLRAHTGTLEILSDEALDITSTRDSVRIQAATRIELTAGGARITLEGPNITFACPGAFTVKAATHAWEGPGGGAVALPALPTALAAEATHWVGTQYLDLESGDAIAGAAYDIEFVGGGRLSGTLNAQGEGRHENVANQPVKRITYKPRTPGKEAAHPALTRLLG